MLEIREPRAGGLAARIEAATPAGRDRSVDALRALAICGVVLGHWLVTALVAAPGGRLTVASPLRSMPWFTPASWVLQTLALFFLVGGYTAAKGHRPGEPYGRWLRRRMSRLLRPVPALLLAWIPLSAGLWLGGFSPGALLTLAGLVLSPLWFLLVYAMLAALTPLVVRLWTRLRLYAVLFPLAVVGLVDLSRFGWGGPAWLGWINVLAGWLVPFLLGVAWADGALSGRRAAAGLGAGGALAAMVLVGFAGYPASMVGVPGAPISNLNPPTLVAVAFGIAQVGLALLLRERLSRWTRRPRLWAGVALANLSAMTIFLWHQTAMMLVTVAALGFGPLPGLHSPPAGPGWAAARLMWLPFFAAALAGCRSVFGRFERSR